MERRNPDKMKKMSREEFLEHYRKFRTIQRELYELFSLLDDYVVKTPDRRRLWKPFVRLQDLEFNFWEPFHDIASADFFTDFWEELRKVQKEVPNVVVWM